VNVCDEGGSILMFRASWTPQDDSQFEAEHPADGEWLEHCRARERAERAAAKKARSIEARRIHQELAQAYGRMIKRAGG
jgi:hypothetical protein